MPATIQLDTTSGLRLVRPALSRASFGAGGGGNDPLVGALHLWRPGPLTSNRILDEVSGVIPIEFTNGTYDSVNGRVETTRLLTPDSPEYYVEFSTSEDFTVVTVFDNNGASRLEVGINTSYSLDQGGIQINQNVSNRWQAYIWDDDYNRDLSDTTNGPTYESNSSGLSFYGVRWDASTVDLLLEEATWSLPVPSGGPWQFPDCALFPCSHFFGNNLPAYWYGTVVFPSFKSDLQIQEIVAALTP